MRRELHGRCFEKLYEPHVPLLTHYTPRLMFICSRFSNIEVTVRYNFSAQRLFPFTFIGCPTHSRCPWYLTDSIFIWLRTDQVWFHSFFHFWQNVAFSDQHDWGWNLKHTQNIILTRIRRLREGNIFSCVCLSIGLIHWEDRTLQKSIIII